MSRGEMTQGGFIEIPEHTESPEHTNKSIVITGTHFHFVSFFITKGYIHVYDLNSFY